MIVAAAFVDSCCEMIEVARERKLLSRLPAFPTGQSPERSITGANRGSISMMLRAILAGLATRRA
ncbi:unannotated protein [freshwater metagenome]|uniref:Unannotated protein n=1 Tax=freshwater metagenome TaxID=449393 RepID=A0A6J6DYS9_9ZZZZ